MRTIATESVQKHYRQAFDEAINVVEKVAREIMKEKPRYKEFVMAMGSYFFIDKDGNNVEMFSSKYVNYKYQYFDADSIFKQLNEFISEWDSYLKITGHPMRFTKDSPIKTDW